MEAKMSTPNVLRASYHQQQNPELEIVELKRKLLEMSTLCQQLQEKFVLMENKMRNCDMQMISTADSPNGYDVASLKEKMRELVLMNVNWQKHNARQDKTIQEQGEKIARLEHELAARGPGQLPESQQIEFDQLLLSKKHQYNTLEEEKERIADENHGLRSNLGELKKSLDDQMERCQLLEAQLVMYQEDFKIERSDRERAQSRIDELEMKLTGNSRNQVLSPVQATSGYNPYDTYSHQQPLPYDMHLRGRGVYQTDGAHEVSASLPTWQSKKTHEGHIGQQKNTVVVATTGVCQSDGLDETDGYRVLDLTEDSPNHHIVLGDVLSCPNCRKAFTRDHHLELLEHMEECE